jgi:hypothetical protein
VPITIPKTLSHYSNVTRMPEKSSVQEPGIEKT